ncbi:hypothetical protein [Frondihabitans sucicola]|nr:hypothetical protein [Frondihabitans sucicola]
MTNDILEAHGGLRTELGDWFPVVEATGVPVPGPRSFPRTATTCSPFSTW